MSKYDSIQTAAKLVAEVQAHSDQGQPDPQGSWSSGRRPTQGTFYSIAFSIWNWEDATRFWNLHTNPERQAWQEDKRIVGELQHKVMVAEIDRDAAKNLPHQREKGLRPH